MEFQWFGMNEKPTHDRMGRRYRDTPVSTGKRITPQDTDILWFQKLHEHGPLPSSFLLEYTARSRKSNKRATERLTDLFNEEDTRHGGRYLDRPPQQFRTIDSRYNQLVYDLAPAGEKALKQAGGLIGRGTRPSGPWVHRLMVSCVTSSIELATFAQSNISFIPQYKILNRAKVGLRYPITITERSSKTSVTKDLIPDAIFGLEYHTPKGSKFRFFCVECDRSTEPATTTNFNRKSWLRSLLQYREYIGNGHYRKHLKLTAPMLVLNVITDERRLEKMIAVTEKETGVSGNTYLLFQYLTDFGTVFRPPSPIQSLLLEPWQRALNDPFLIHEP